VDYTAIATHLDPEALRQLMENVFSAWRHIVIQFHGTVVRTMGDGILAYFGYPEAFEECAVQAAFAAMAITKLATAPATIEPSDVSQLAVRVGLATGEVIVGGWMGEDASRELPAIGIAPILAARLQGLAQPNVAVVDARTRDLIAADFECEALGAFDLKGFRAPVPAWRLLGARRGPSRFIVRRPRGPITIVGRHAETALLRRLWMQACGGAGQAVFVSGDPGIGKSHLCEAFLQGSEPPASAVVRIQCSALHMNTAFHSVIEEIAGSAGISHDDDASLRLEKLKTLLGTCTDDIEPLVPVFARLLSLPIGDSYPEFEAAQNTHNKTVDGLVERLRLLSRRGPSVLFVEDVQWADPSTHDFLAAAIGRLSSERILILITARTGFSPGWSSASQVTMLPLDALDPASIARLLAGATGEYALDDAMRALIVQRAQGVPLFAQEIARWILLSAGGAGGFDRGASKSTIPATLHDLLVSQLDKLGPAKFAAQLGAIIGRTFPYWLLSRLWPFEEASLRPLLDDIVDAGLLVREQQGAEESYVFKHELLRDAAYESLPQGKREPLHLRIAQIILSERTRASAMRPELIAHHYVVAGLGDKAAPLWLVAGQLALRESANREALASLRSGLDCLKYLPEAPERWRLELRLQTCLGQALIAVSGHASREMLQAFSRAHELSMTMDEVPELFTIVWGITAHHLVRGDIRMHLKLSAELLEIAEKSQDSGELVVAHTSRTISLYFAGQFAAAREHLDEVLSRYDWDRHRHLAQTFAVDRKMIALQFGTWILWKLGYADQAARMEQELNVHTRRLAHANSLVQGLTGGASVYMLRREPDRLLARVSEGIRIAEMRGYPVWIDHAGFWVGWSLAEKGFVEEGIAQIQQALEAYCRPGAGSSLPKFLGLLADRLGEVGRCDDGLQLLDRALEHIERTGERATEAETWRLRGKLLLACNPGDFGKAEACLRKAIDVAREQDAKAWELRAATTLASMLRQRGERLKARECLAPVYEWFREGLDTPDLLDARALLRDLS
jgi:predicted ATPase/class 3 adenylate cyclase